MINEQTRRIILHLSDSGMSQRSIAQTLKISRDVVRKVIALGTAELQRTGRDSALDEHRDRIIHEIRACKGNLARVCEVLDEDGIKIAYPTLTRYVRVNHLKEGGGPKLPVGRHEYGPGVEMQHDTSPHDVTFVDGVRRCQCASLIIAHSHMKYFQYYPRFSRLECKIFLVHAVKWFGGACERCIVDNSNLVVLHGTGPDAVMVPEMVSFAERLGFKFQATKRKDPNRNPQVERSFHHIENSFLNRRVFTDFHDLNQRAVAWCDKYNHTKRQKLKTRPIDLFATELRHLQPLPDYIPEPYRVYSRKVDVEGYVHLHANRYSVPWRMIGREVEVLEYELLIRINHGPREVAVHDKLPAGSNKRGTIKAHRPSRSYGNPRSTAPIPEETALRRRSELMSRYVDLLKGCSRGRAVRPLKQLHRIVAEYAPEPLSDALRDALHYRMTDLHRLERMVLKRIGDRFFDLQHQAADPNRDNDNEEGQHYE